ncbi:hypothetical protein NDU88_005828 [Pleurodeles waltl]|uniref:Uncharacterized protein n=1 Tax=Pleurodeles waltl TaxID=8319 RepID=A0AAV7UN77_PLEWA|nr:hypothetical protein NDU88_005828 [Pleurodeles waltl]
MLVKCLCDELTPSRSIPPYPWGTSAVVVPDPDADRSGTNPHPGDVGLRKALLTIARERMGEREAVDKTREKVVLKRTVAVSVDVAAPLRGASLALREAAAAPGPPAASEEAEPAPDAGPTATPGGAAEEGGRTVWVWSHAADADTRMWCPTMVVSPPQQPSPGQEVRGLQTKKVHSCSI